MLQKSPIVFAPPFPFVPPTPAPPGGTNAPYGDMVLFVLLFALVV